MKYLRLTFIMLRYRVAVMLLLFYFLGVFSHQSSINFSWNFIWATMALSGSYIAATSINDIVDKKIDKINHPEGKGRPLVSGEGTKKDLINIHFLSSLTSIAFSFLISKNATFIVLASLLVNYLYSAPPFRLSFRTYLAPVLLSVAYVVLPLALGIESVKLTLMGSDILFILSLMFMFFGRIILKDFRDIEGDKRFGKPTLLLRFGKLRTITLSFGAILTGNLLLFSALPINQPFILVLLEILFVAIYISGIFLLNAKNKESEQVAIGIGAKMGNGLLISILGILILIGYKAPHYIINLFTLTAVSMYIINFVWLIRKPFYAVYGYKG